MADDKTMGILAVLSGLTSGIVKGIEMRNEREEKLAKIESEEKRTALTDSLRLLEVGLHVKRDVRETAAAGEKAKKALGEPAREQQEYRQKELSIGKGTAELIKMRNFLTAKRDNAVLDGRMSVGDEGYIAASSEIDNLNKTIESAGAKQEKGKPTPAQQTAPVKPVKEKTKGVPTGAVPSDAFEAVMAAGGKAKPAAKPDQEYIESLKTREKVDAIGSELLRYTDPRVQREIFNRHYQSAAGNPKLQNSLDEKMREILINQARGIF